MRTAALTKYRQRMADGKIADLDDWGATAQQRTAVRRALLGALDKLIALGRYGKVEDATEILRTCVERLNAVDEGFICTIEREELCEILYDIGGFCGMPADEDWVDEWRDW
jgi:hypothetical protein